MDNKTMNPGIAQTGAEARRAYHQEWEKKHADERKAYKKAWRETHRDHVKVWNRRYWEKKTGAAAHSTDPPAEN